MSQKTSLHNLLVLLTNYITRAELFAKNLDISTQNKKKKRFSYHSLTITLKTYHSLSFYIGKPLLYLKQFLIPYSEPLPFTIFIHWETYSLS